MNGSALMNIRTINDVDVTGKRVMLRVDLNVPIVNGAVLDITRIQKIIPTIRSLTDRGARVIVLSHLGRPNGCENKDLSLRLVANALSELLNGIKVRFIDDAIGPAARDGVNRTGNGEIAVLENLRFYPGEEANDPGFVRELGELGDIYVNEAFSCAHRAHASTYGLASLLPAYAGPSMMAEIDALETVLGSPKRPVAAVVGGAKVSTKLPVLKNLVGKVDVLIVGGGMANTFFHAAGHSIGKSLCEPDLAAEVTEIMNRAQQAGCRIVLPECAVVAEKFEAGAVLGTFKLGDIPDQGMILDIGPDSQSLVLNEISRCRTLLWNGPLGAFEISPFGDGTNAVAREAARLTRQARLITVAGGGDTIAALNAAGVGEDFTYVSTAGGAFLEWLEGRELPGIQALLPNQDHQLARSA